MNFSSKRIEEAVNAFASLPGIGRKTALRLVLHLIKQPESITESFTHDILQMRQSIKECSQCGNLSDQEVCSICLDKSRDQALICIVENIRDLMAIEDTNQYRGLYHVLGGVISPLEGVGPDDLKITSLVERIAKRGPDQHTEIIMAVSPTIEGETTIFYLAKQLEGYPVTISTIARGVSFGGELEYADELTLGRSITARTPYHK